MPLGFEPGVAQAQLAMSERYGDRLVNSLAQAGQTIENGLKAVTTMKELSSLGQQMSQLSPESPDYQQQLIGLGARHPFAMQTPQAQQMIQAGNQQHLQWKSQQHAIAMSERQEKRADARLAMSEKNQLRRDATQMAIAKLRLSADGEEQLPEIPEQFATPPTTGLFSHGLGMNKPGQLVSTPESTEQIEIPGKELTPEQAMSNRVRSAEGLIGGPRTAKRREKLVVQDITQQGINERAGNRSADVNDRFYAGLDAKADALEFNKLKFEKQQEAKAKTEAARQAAAKLIADGKLTHVQSAKLKSFQKEMDDSIALADLALLSLRKAEVTGENKDAIQAQATAARMAAMEAADAFEKYTQEIGGGSKSKKLKWNDETGTLE